LDEHQRRVWGRMIEEVDANREGHIGLEHLAIDLKGLLGASDPHSDRLTREFWNHFAQINMEASCAATPGGHPRPPHRMKAS
jgi:hypothetical protein